MKNTAKEENCAVVLLYVLMNETPTIDIMLCGFLSFCAQINEGV